MAPQRLIEKLRETMLRMHRNESGAIVLLCFAGCLFLFAMALVLYDAGSLSRDKVDVQVAADTAGYSQAAAKARAMNMVAFANVGKRTISGIRNMYFYQYPNYMSWLDGQCSKCCCGMFCGCWTECLNCAGNWLSLVPIFEGIDYIFFMLGRFVGDDLTDYLEALDTYQEEMTEFAPYWAFGEGIVRGVRNGANVVTTYPMPDNDEYGSLPLERDDGFFAAYEACLAPTWLFNPSSPGTMIEWGVNFAVLKDRSVSKPPPALKGPAEVVNPMHSFTGCLSMLPIFKDAKAAVPYHLSAEGNSGEDYMAKSNFVWSYRYNDEYSGQLRDNYNAVLSKDYDTNLMAMPEGGLWGMSRSEIYYPEDNLPHIPSFDNPNGMWMFHPSWIGKLRPVVLKEEEVPVDPSDMWSEARGMALKEGPLFGVGMSDLGKDVLYMEKVSRNMDGQIEGREALDGISK
ncbi:MAG: Tad domain-containing protein [Persicimonas sp.]